jgi:hypothetical protein
MALTEEKIAALKAKYGGELRCVETPFGEFVFKPPSRAAHDKWQDARLDKIGEPSAVSRELAMNCLCSPDYTFESLIAVLDKLPGLLQGEIMNAIGEMSGLTQKYPVSKL